jgi:hypothetical protein
MSETEGGQTDEGGRRHILDKQTTQTEKRGISTRLQVLQSKDFNCKVLMTQFERWWQQTATNEQTIEEQSPFRIVNPPTHSCCTMPRFISTPPPRAPVSSWPCHRHGTETRLTDANAHEQTRNAKRKAAGKGSPRTTRTRFRGHYAIILDIRLGTKRGGLALANSQHGRHHGRPAGNGQDSEAISMQKWNELNSRTQQGAECPPTNTTPAANQLHFVSVALD